MTCKETVCTKCIHLPVCSLKERFIKAQEAVDDTTVHLGDGRMIRLRDIDYIIPVNLECKHFYRNGGTITR